MKIKDYINKINQFLVRFYVEILILIGILCIVYATFIINYLVGLYLIGVISILFGLFFASKKQ